MIAHQQLLGLFLIDRPLLQVLLQVQLFHCTSPTYRTSRTSHRYLSVGEGVGLAGTCLDRVEARPCAPW